LVFITTLRNNPMPNDDTSDLLTEVAAGAARLIAEDGMDYASAKRRAAAELVGERAARRALPDNAAVERELRRHLRLFGGDEYLQRLAALRAIALRWMQDLAPFRPHLVGAVLNGTATEHSDIHLHLYTESAKDVEMQLLDRGLTYEAAPAAGRSEGVPEALEELSLVIAPRDARVPHRIGLVLTVYPTDAIRVAARRSASGDDLHPVAASGRADAGRLEQLIAVES
jgi:hypothetical protein